MALLGMGANMQFNGYFPGYYSTRDLIFGAEGTWTSSNGNNELKNDCYQIGSLLSSSSCHPLGYNKEHLKQTILKHEAIFRDQIHELHRIYQKQRELMDEIKRNELYKHNIRLETSWSSSSLCYSPNLPWSAGQSSVLLAESIQLPLGHVQEKSRQICPAPAPTVKRECLKDFKLSESTYRKVGKKILDLQLPADEYIDCEGDSLGNERAFGVPQFLAYTLNGSSQVMCNNDEKPYETKFNGFTDLNIPFKLEEESGAKSDDLGVPLHHRNYPFHDLSKRTKLDSHNYSNVVIQNSNKRQDREASSDDPLPNQGKKQGGLSSSNTVGQNGDVLDSLAKFNDTERQSVSVDSLSKKLVKVNGFPCFHSLHQITQGPLTEDSAGTQGCTSCGWLGPSSASCRVAPYQLVSEADMKSSAISPAVLWKNIKSSHNLECQSYLLSSSFCSKSKLMDLPSTGTDDLNICDNHCSSSASHECRKYVKGAEDMGTPKNINLNIMPAGDSDTTAFQSIQITGEEDRFNDSRLLWLKENPVPKGKSNEESLTSTQNESTLLDHFEPVDTHCGVKLNKIEENDLGREMTHAFDVNIKPPLSKVCRNLSKIQWIEENEKISDVRSPCNHVPHMGKQIPAGELMENEKTKHERLAGIIDLNSCMNEDENTPMTVDFQAPASLYNKENSPPKGESNENLVEMPLQLTRQEDPEALDKQARIAAEALVSISGVTAHNGLQMVTCPPSESFSSSPLHWFAGIVSTIVDHSENEVKLDFSGKANDLEEFLPADFDFFEFMTLNLTETKVLDCCDTSMGQNEQEGESTSPTQPRKYRKNRGRMGKDFQSEILPSLASLSRYEVTEDLQTIGGLVEAASTRSATGYLRSAGRNVLAKGRKRPCISTSNVTDLHLNLKQLNSNSEMVIEKRGLVSWGKICRKRRGQRFPISNPQIILSQVYN